MLKKCTKCGIEKEVEMFYKNSRKKDGLFSCCKDCNKEHRKEYDKEYRDRPEVKEHRKEYHKKYHKEYYSRPETKERRKEYYSKTDVKEHRKDYLKEYNGRPEVKAYKKEYDKRPEIKERKNEQAKKYLDKHKHQPIVYLMDSQTGMLKIGITTMIKLRLAQITNEVKLFTQKPVICHHYIPCEDENSCRDLESQLHTKFKEFRLNKEWFSSAPSIIEYFKENGTLYREEDFDE